MKNGQKGGSRPRKLPDLSGYDDPEILAAIEGEGAGGEDAFEDFLEDFTSDPQKPLRFLRSYLAGEDAYNPAVDVVESRECLTIIADLPGVIEKDLRVEFVEGGAVLRGRREPAPNALGTTLRRAERPAGEFTKSVPLPHGLDVKAVSYTLNHGVLTVILPRLRSADEPEPKRIKPAR